MLNRTVGQMERLGKQLYISLYACELKTYPEVSLSECDCNFKEVEDSVSLFSSFFFPFAFIV